MVGGGGPGLFSNPAKFPAIERLGLIRNGFLEQSGTQIAVPINTAPTFFSRDLTGSTKKTNHENRFLEEKKKLSNWDATFKTQMKFSFGIFRFCFG